VTESKKRKISAREILADIRSGMDDSQLKRRYGLSDAALASVCRKLVQAGVLTEAEILNRSRSEADVAESYGRPKTTEWQCPACNAVSSVEAPECPACGVVVSKFLARQKPETGTPIFVVEATIRPRKGWTVVLCCIAALMAVGGFLILRSGQKGREKPPIVAKDVRLREATRAEPITKFPTETEIDPYSGERVELQFSDQGFPLGLPVSEGFALHLFETPGPDQGFKKLPPETAAKMYYDEFRIAGRTFRVITEASDPPKFYLDANGNGDLTDDPGPFMGEKSGLVPNHYTVQLPYPNEETGVPYRMWMFLSRMGGVRFYPACHWHGQIDLNGRTYPLILFDGNADGDYSNDPMGIDVDGDGKVADTERLKPGQDITIDGTVVTLISIAPSGRWVRLKFSERSPEDEEKTDESKE